MHTVFSPSFEVSMLEQIRFSFGHLPTTEPFWFCPVALGMECRVYVGLGETSTQLHCLMKFVLFYFVSVLNATKTKCHQLSVPMTPTNVTVFQ